MQQGLSVQNRVIRLEGTVSICANSKDEITRSPITVVATVIGVVVSSLALLVAWLQYAGAPASSSLAAGSEAPSQIKVANLLVCIAFFLASSLSLASLVRMLARLHWFAALVLSIPSASLSAFGTMVVVFLLPTGPRGPVAFTTAQDVVFYGTVFVFIAINGNAVMRGLAKSKRQSSSDSEKDPDTIGFFGAALFLLFAWGGFVSAGLSKLVRAFLFA